MATKAPKKSVRKRSKVGVAVVYEEWQKKRKVWVWRTSIRRKLIEKKNQRRTFETEEEAKAYAVEMDHLYQKRKLKKIEILDPVYNERFLLAQEAIDRFNRNEIEK